MMDPIIAIDSSPKTYHLGNVQVDWEEIDPGFAFITTEGGSIEDRHLAHSLCKLDLIQNGYLVAESYMPERHGIHQRIAKWNDVMNKAKRLIEEGNVQILRNGYNNVVALVKGDNPSSQVDIVNHHRTDEVHPQQTYQVEFSRDDPSSRAMTQGNCECAWNKYKYDRNLQFKNLESRSCAHLLAAWWLSQATPLDEDIHPSTQYRQNPQQTLFNPGESPPGTATFPQPGEQQGNPPLSPEIAPQGPAAPSQVPSQTPSQTSPLIAPQTSPAQLSLIPPSREDMADMIAQMPVSAPNVNPPNNPRNPINRPGTLSYYVKSDSGLDFQPGDVVRLNRPCVAEKQRGAGSSSTGEWMDAGTDNGQWTEIAKNSEGTIFDFEPISGFVVVDFPLDGGAGTSYHARAWISASDISPVNRQPRPTPFIKRRPAPQASPSNFT